MSLINRISSYFSSASSTTRRRAKALGHVTTESLEVRTFPSVVAISLSNGSLEMTAGNNEPHHVRMYRANGVWEINGGVNTRFIYGGTVSNTVRLPANVTVFRTVNLNFQLGQNDVAIKDLYTTSHVVYRGSPLADKFVLEASSSTGQTVIGGGLEFWGGTGGPDEIKIMPGTTVTGLTLLGANHSKFFVGASPHLPTQLKFGLFIAGESPEVSIQSIERGLLTITGSVSVQSIRGSSRFEMLGFKNEDDVPGHDQPSLQILGNVRVDGAESRDYVHIGSDVNVRGSVDISTGSGNDMIQIGVEPQASRYGCLKIGGQLNVRSGTGHDSITVGEFGRDPDFDISSRTTFTGAVTIISTESMNLLVGLADFPKSLAVQTGTATQEMPVSNIRLRGGRFGTVVIIATGVVDMTNEAETNFGRSPGEELRFNSGILVMIDGIVRLGTRNGGPVRLSQSPNHRITIIGTPRRFTKAWLERFNIPVGVPFSLTNVSVR